MINLFKKILTYFNNKSRGFCNCEDNWFYTKVYRINKYKKETKYFCDKCNFEHPYWFYEGSSFSVNPALRQFIHEKSLKEMYPSLLLSKDIRKHREFFNDIIEKIVEDTPY